MFQKIKNRLDKTSPAWIMFFIVAAGALLRFYRLGYNDLWFDEAYAVVLRSNEIFRITELFPLFYAILHQWIHLFGNSEFSLRLLPALFSICSIPLIYPIGYRFFDKKVGLFSAAIFAFSPFQLWYAQEVQPYSAAVFFALLIVHLFFKAVESNKIIFWWFLGLVYILGLYIDEFLLFFIPVQAVYLFFKQRNYLKYFNFIIFVSVVLLLLKITTISSLINLIQTKGFWIPKPEIYAPLVTLENFGFGYNLSNSIYLVSDILIGLILISVIYNLRNKISSQKSVIFCLICLLSPIILVLFFSRFYFSIYTDRRFIPFSPFYYLILAFGVTSLRTKWLKYCCFFALAVLLILGIKGYFNGSLPNPVLHRIGIQPKLPFYPAIELIKEDFRPDDIIAHANSESMTPFTFYLRKNKIITKQYFFTSALNQDSWAGFYAAESGDSAVIENMPPDFMKKRIWFVCSNWNRSKELQLNAEIVKKWLDKNFRQELASELYGVWVFRYVPRT